MNKAIYVIAGTGLDEKTRKSHWPARLDVIQSANGLFPSLFMWGHMAFVSSILISNDAMWWVTKMFEGRFVFGKNHPSIVGANRCPSCDRVRAACFSRHAHVPGEFRAVQDFNRAAKDDAP